MNDFKMGQSWVLCQVGQKGTEETSFLDLFPSHKIQQENKNVVDQIN